VLNSLRKKVKRLSYRLTLSATFVAIILITNGVLTPTIAYATDSGEEATDSETPVSNTETASSEVIQESDSEADTQSAVEEEEPAAAAAVMSFEESSSSATVTETVTSGGDDSSYLIPLDVPILFDGVYFTNAYATTNSVITFGQPDGTFHDYPMTPSVSLQARDWWARPHMGDEWFIIRTSSGGFQVDGSYRPYGTDGGPTTNIVITAQILTNGTVSYSYSVVGPLYGGERTGARLNDGTVATLEQVGVEEVEEPVVLEPEPIPEPEPEPEPTYFLNAPTNLVVTPNADGSVTLSWTAPEPSNAQVERYAVSWSTGSSGWGVASTTTSITLDASIFETTGGLDTAYNFTVRADNDSLSVYSNASTPVEATPSITPVEPEPTPPAIPDGSSVASEGTVVEITAPEGQRIASIVGYYGDPNDSTRGGEVSSILSELSAGLTSVSIEVSNTTFENDPAPGTPKILIYLVTYEDVAPSEPSPVSPVPSSAEPERTPLLLPALVQPTPQPAPAVPAPTPQVVSPEPTSEDLLDEVLADPSSSVEERVDAIIATLVAGKAIDAAVLADAGVSFEDLPPETPIELREDADGNPVIIDAATAASLEVFESPQAFIEEVFTDPAQALEAVRNIGKDMSEEEREESQEIVVAAVIVANVAGLATHAAATGGVVAYRRNL
jgi:hypothetical protein